MQFDFHNHFQTYTTSQLLSIIQYQDDYQPEALLAAQDLLAQRQVNIEEALAALQKAQSAVPMSVTPANTQDSKNILAEFEEEVNKGSINWYQPFTILIFIFHLYAAFQQYEYLIWYFRSQEYRPPIYDALFSDVLLAWNLVILSLLLFRKRVAWMLVTARAIVSAVIQIRIMYRLLHPPYANLLQFLPLLVINVLILVWMLQVRVRGQYEITSDTQKKTIITGSILSAVYISVLLLTNSM